MSREVHVRFCEGLGVRFPRATRLVVGFRDLRDAQRMMEVLPKRFGKYGLTIHPDKTRLVSFHKPSMTATDRDRADERPGTFDFLGFTHFWARSRRGFWIVKRKTASNRFSRAVRSIDAWCRQNRHQPVGLQQQKLNQKIRGHCAYYGITGNGSALARFYCHVTKSWWKWLNRRNRQRELTWEAFACLLKRYPLAPVRTVHSVYGRAAKL